MAKLDAKDVAAVARVIELIERDGWDNDKRLADMVRSWLKGKL